MVHGLITVGVVLGMGLMAVAATTGLGFLALRLLVLGMARRLAAGAAGPNSLGRMAG